LFNRPGNQAVGYAVVDHHRSLRQGVNEVIFGQNKTAEQILGITKNMLENNEQDIIITRLSHESAEFLSDKIPIEYHKLPKLGIVNQNKEKPQTGSIIVASGGTTALLAMLNSCASGVSVVNIDNGFGAGFIASRINKMGDSK
jgi:NCAIR mutase (PurE)-related protein